MEEACGTSTWPSQSLRKQSKQVVRSLIMTLLLRGRPDTVLEQRAVRGLCNAPSCTRRREDAVQQGADKDSRDATIAVTSHLRIIVTQ